MESLSKELQWRGFVSQTTLKDTAQLDTTLLTFYWGVDPSAPSMTIGNLAAAMMVRHFIAHGHKAVLLVGGATGMIGDPDGKKDERNLKALDEISANKASIIEQYKRVFAGQDFTVVDNYDWFKDIGYVDFLRTVGKHLSMTQLLQREFVQSRIGEGGSGISYAEFSYSLIQGYDFLHLYRNHGVTLQVCGADQWGNSLAGVELIRKIDGGEAHVWSTPLIVDKTTGKKFGKTEAGAVWVDESLTSVYQFYQFWLNAGDADVIDYMKVYTLLPKVEIDALAAQTADQPAQRAAQKALAFEVTKLVHGQDRAESVRRVSEVLFGSRVFEDLSDNDLNELAQEIPIVPTGVTVADALVQAGVAGSKGEVARLVKSGGVTIGSQRATDESHVLEAKTLLKKGKNAFVLVR